MADPVSIASLKGLFETLGNEKQAQWQTDKLKEIALKLDKFGDSLRDVMETVSSLKVDYTKRQTAGASSTNARDPPPDMKPKVGSGKSASVVSIRTSKG